MSFKTFVDYNDDNAVKAIENFEETKSSKEDESGMNNINAILKDAVAVWVDITGIGKKSRFEKLLDGRWFEWKTHVSYDGDWFKNALSKKTFGEDYVVEYV